MREQALGFGLEHAAEADILADTGRAAWLAIAKRKSVASAQRLRSASSQADNSSDTSAASSWNASCSLQKA